MSENIVVNRKLLQDLKDELSEFELDPTLSASVYPYELKDLIKAITKVSEKIEQILMTAETKK